MTITNRGSDLSAMRDGYDLILREHLPSWCQREEDALRQGRTRLPAATVAELRSSLLLAAPIPREDGGGGADLPSTVHALQRIGAVAPSTALCIAMPLANAANARLPERAVTAEQRARLASGRQFLIEQVLSGKILAVANSEPGAQGDLANTRTRAERGRNGCVLLTGEKCFATLGADADFFLCSARDEEGLLDAFFVPRDAAGVTLADDWDALGMRLSASVSLRLERAQAAARFLYPGAIAQVSARHWSTLLLAAVFVGVGEGVLAMVRAHATKLTSYARASLAEAALALEAARSFIDVVARDEQLPCSAAYIERCRRAKTFATKAAYQLATCAMTLGGGHSYRPQQPLARFLLDAAAGPLLRPPLPQAMDALANELFGEVSGST